MSNGSHGLCGKKRSTKISQFSKVFQPLFPNQIGVGLYDAKQLAQFNGGNLCVAVGQDRLSGLCQPYLGGIRPGYAFDNMHMNRLKRTALVKPEKDDIRPDFNNLRHW